MTCHLHFAMPLVVAAALALATEVVAVQRTFVSGNGSDANPCSINAPCRGFTQAMSLTDPDGEIIVLDSAGYGPVVVNKSVSIIAPPGVYAGITVFTGDGVVISGAGIKVVLRGLSINGQGGNRGILYTFASELLVERCTISSMLQDGVAIGWGGKVAIVDSVIRNNGGKGVSVTLDPLVTVLRTRVEQNQSSGVYFAPTVAGASLSVIDAHLAGNSGGIAMIAQNVATSATVVGTTSADSVASSGISMSTNGNGGAITAEVRNSTVVRNATYGIVGTVNTGTGSISALLKDNLVAENPTDGILSFKAGTLFVIDGNTVTHNGDGVVQSTGGIIQTRFNNTVRENGTDVVGGAPTFVGGT